MKICFIADGGSDHTQVIANYFSANNHDVHLISPRFRKGYDKGIYLHELKNYLPWLGNNSISLSYLFWILNVKTIVRAIKPDIINVHYITSYGLLTLMTDFHPLVTTAWGSDILIQPRRNLFWRFIVSRILRKSDLFTCLFDVAILNNNMSKLIPKYTKIASIPHGIDTDLFNSRNDSNYLKQKYNISNHDPVIINIRGLHPIFDPDTFLKAIPIVIKKYPEAKFLIPFQDKYKPHYLEIVKDLQIEKNLIILNWLTPEEVAQHLNISDIFVSSALSDGASNALFEGMACELAPVVTDIPANRCWIKDNQNGLLFKPKDYNALAQKICYLIDNKDVCLEFGKISRKIVTEKAELKNQMETTVKLYQKLVDECSPH